MANFSALALKTGVDSNEADIYATLLLDTEASVLRGDEACPKCCTITVSLILLDADQMSALQYCSQVAHDVNLASRPFRTYGQPNATDCEHNRQHRMHQLFTKFTFCTHELHKGCEPVRASALYADLFHTYGRSDSHKQTSTGTVDHACTYQERCLQMCQSIYLYIYIYIYFRSIYREYIDMQ